MAKKSTASATSKKASTAKKPRRPRPKRRSAQGRLVATLLAALSGCLVFLSFPTWDLFFLEWFALVPLLWVLEDSSPRGALWYGWVTGFATNLGGFYWIDPLLRDFGHLPSVASVPLTVVFVAYQGLVFMLWAWAVLWLRERTRLGFFTLGPAAFVVIEYLFPLIFPWYLANGQYTFYPATQIAEWTGVLGITFVIVLANVAVYAILRGLTKGRRVPVFAVTLSGLVVAATIGYGLVRIGQIDAAVEAAPKLRVGMVESNVGIWEKEARSIPPEKRVSSLYQFLLRHHRMSAELEAKGAELIVWPESSYFPVDDVWAKRSDLFAVAVGDAGAMLQKRGHEWFGSDQSERYPFPDPAVARIGLHAVWAASERDALAVGEGGLALHFDGQSWRTEETGVGSTLRAVDGVKPARKAARGARVAVAAGDGGTVLLRDQSGRWTPQPRVFTSNLTAVAAVRTDALYVFDEAGAGFRYDGGSWSRIPEAGGRIRAATHSPNGGLWVVGEDGFAARFDGARWRKTPTGTKQPLHAVVAAAGDLVLAAGGHGTLLVWDGSRWGAITTSERGTIRGLAVDPLGGLLAVGDGGVVLRIESGQVERLPTPTGARLRAIAAMGFERAFPIPRDVAWLRPASTPLPNVADEAAAERADRVTPVSERNAVLRGFSTPLLFGGITGFRAKGPDDERTVYNAALFLGPDGRVLGNYEKNYLLMFGEYIPFEYHFSKAVRDKLHDLIPEAGRFTPGDTVETFSFRDHRLGIMVCYEGIIPAFTRLLAGREPNVLINLVNDAWFGKTDEPYLHLALATFRAIENRLTLVRSTNTGVSAFVDPVGRIRQQTSLDHAESLIDDVPMMSLETFYRSYGDLLAYACMVWIGLLAAWGLRGAGKKRKKRKATKKKAKA